MNASIDLSAPSHTRTGRLLENFFRYLPTLSDPVNKNMTPYYSRIAHGGMSSLILYEQFIDIDELEVITDLMCENIKNKKLAIYFREYILKSFKESSKDLGLQSKIDNFKA